MKTSRKLKHKTLIFLISLGLGVVAADVLWKNVDWDVFPLIQQRRMYCSHNSVESPYCDFSVVRTLKGHSTVSALAISADGKTLVSGGQDKAIKVWDLQTGQLRKTLQSDSGAIYDLAIAPDGKTVVSGSSDRRVRIWDINSDQRPKMLAAHNYKVDQVKISLDGKTIVSHSDDQIKVWDLGTGRAQATLPFPYAKLLDISPDGQTVFIELSSSKLVAWDVATNQQKVLPISFAPDLAHISLDGQTLISTKKGKRDFRLKVSDLTTGKLNAEKRFSRKVFQPFNVAISRDFLIGNTRHGLVFWNLQTAKLEATLNQENLKHLVVSSDGKLLAGISGNSDNSNAKIKVLQRP